MAFIAIPVLGLFGYDLINEIQPWALLLNGLTAISAAIAFWKAGMVDKRGALILIVITTIGAPIGVWLLQFASADLVWWLYVGVLIFLAIRMLMPKRASTEVVAEITDESRAKAAVAAAPISVFAGFLGVGPGFLLMPTLTLVGYSARLAAATNSVAVTVPSFSAFISHLPTATFDWPTVIITSIAAVIGSWLGARFTAGRVKSATLSRIFAVALVLLARPARLDPPVMTATQPPVNEPQRRQTMQTQLPVLDLRMNLPAPDVADAVAAAVILADPIRASIVRMLHDGPVCVCEMAAALGSRENNVSNHLAKLRDAGLVKAGRYEADTRRVYYERDEDACRRALDVLAEILS